MEYSKTEIYKSDDNTSFRKKKDRRTIILKKEINYMENINEDLIKTRNLGRNWGYYHLMISFFSGIQKCYFL